MVGFSCLPQNVGPWWGLMNAIYCSVNVDGVVDVLGGSGDTWGHIIIKLI